MLLHALSTFETEKCDVVQGQCAVRNANTFITKIIAIEFSEMYNIGHQGRTSLFNLGIFGGSNGIWKGQLLIDTKMDGDMLTEDIDSSVRTMLVGSKISYCSNMISYELAPLSWTSLINQRKRWSQGWLEVSLKYCRICMTSTNLSLKQKIGCFFLFFWREFFVYIFIFPIIIVFDYYLRDSSISTTKIYTILTSVNILIGAFRSMVVIFAQNQYLHTNLPKYWYIIYILFYPFYAMFMNIIQLIAHAQYITNNNNWIATSRIE